MILCLSREAETGSCFVSQLRGVGDLRVARKRCHGILKCLRDSMAISPSGIVHGLGTLTSFGLVVLDVTFCGRMYNDGHCFASSSWPCFDTYAEELKPELQYESASLLPSQHPSGLSPS